MGSSVKRLKEEIILAKKKCGGCGIILQSEDKDIPGYLPENKIKEAHPVCQRCFKIKNYGAYMPVSLTDADYKKEVTTLLRAMDIVIVLVDVIDFEGSFDAEIISVIKNKKFILAVNKIDLVPGRKHPAEITNWLKGRLFHAGITPADIVMMSTKTNYGVNGVIRKLRYFLPKGGNVAVIGATNVGKSSLINGLFGKNTVTVSKYPGTTLKTVKFQLPKTQTFIHDTPGLIPKGRISDMVCESCNLKIVPSSEISRKTFKLPYDRVFMFGGLAWMRILTNYETNPIFTAYASKEVPFHETNVDKVETILKDKIGDFLTPPCDSCKDEYYAKEWKTEVLEIEEKEELVFKGLGWITVKRGPLKVEVHVPKDAELIIRDAFVEPKRASNEESYDD